MKTFKLIHEDKNGNELKTIVKNFVNKKEALNYAKLIKSNSQLNDLKKIIVKTL